MTWKTLRPALLLAAGAAGFSCSTHTAVTDVNAVPAEVLASRVRARDAALESMAGRGSVAFESPDRAGSAFFELALRKPDSLLVTLRGPLGIGAGFLFLSRSRYVMYNSMENRVVTGVPSAAAIRSVIPLDLTFDQIMDAFTGGFAVPAAAPLRYTVDDGKYLLVYAKGGGTESFWIDPEYDLVVRYELHDAAGAILMQAESSQVVTQDRSCAPRHVTVDFPDEGRHLSIHYSSLDLNAEDLSFAYSVPPGARTSAR
ncbi:MAG TPA: DUF4292 domain-containing protein [Bacteroidota bacterium]|nr:DUF4292 domain-containing protein [Bacteroidota bacterium]